MIAHVSHDDDGTLTVEWIDVNTRFGISYDHDEKKWFWFYASQTTYDHGWLPDELVDAIVNSYFRDRGSPYMSVVPWR